MTSRSRYDDRDRRDDRGGGDRYDRDRRDDRRGEDRDRRDDRSSRDRGGDRYDRDRGSGRSRDDRDDRYRSSRDKDRRGSAETDEVYPSKDRGDRYDDRDRRDDRSSRSRGRGDQAEDELVKEIYRNFYELFDTFKNETRGVAKGLGSRTLERMQEPFIPIKLGEDSKSRREPSTYDMLLEFSTIANECRSYLKDVKHDRNKFFSEPHKATSKDRQSQREYDRLKDDYKMLKKEYEDRVGRPPRFLMDRDDNKRYDRDDRRRDDRDRRDDRGGDRDRYDRDDDRGGRRDDRYSSSRGRDDRDRDDKRRDDRRGDDRDRRDDKYSSRDRDSRETRGRDDRRDDRDRRRDDGRRDRY